MIISIGIVDLRFGWFQSDVPRIRRGRGEGLKLSAIPSFITTDDIANLSPAYGDGGYT